MTLTANDGSGTSNDSATITVTIYVTDEDEKPKITSSGSALVITGPRSASQAEGVGGEVATYSVSGGAGGTVVLEPDRHRRRGLQDQFVAVW